MRSIPLSHAVRLDVGESSVDIANAGRTLLSDCGAAISLSDGTRFVVHDLRLGNSSDARQPGVSLTSPQSGQSPEMHWRFTQIGDQPLLELQLELRNRGSEALSIQRIDVLSAPSGYLGQALSGLKVMQPGWQSWSLASPPMPIPPGGWPTEMPGPLYPPLRPAEFVLPGFTVLDPAASTGQESPLLAGFSSSHNWSTGIMLAPAARGHQLVASCWLEGAMLEPSKHLSSEKLLLAFEDSTEASLQQYGLELGRNMNARRWPAAPTGWCSWY